jgi:type IV fimbrial biogenesis protein FimT
VPIARARGFTVIELLAVIAVLAVVVALSVPSLRSFAASQRARTLSIDLASDLLTARSEALKRNADVVVAPAGGTWAEGWTVTSGATVLSSRPASTGTFEFTGGTGAITFNRFGRVSAPANGVRITVKPTEVQGSGERCIELDTSGRARAKLGACT